MVAEEEEEEEKKRRRWRKVRYILHGEWEESDAEKRGRLEGRGKLFLSKDHCHTCKTDSTRHTPHAPSTSHRVQTDFD